jgi:signal transduction histidine kinase
MSVVEVCDCIKSSQMDRFVLLHQIQTTLSNRIEKKIFLKNYRQWFQKIIPFKSIAFILFDSGKRIHSIYDIFPASFQVDINQQLEDGIIFWAGQNKQIFVNDQKIFMPLHFNESYIGIIEIIPKKQLDILDNKVKILFELVGNFIADYFNKIHGKKNVSENSQNDELAHLALFGAISNGVIHEISNPLTTIIGRAGLLQNNQVNLQTNLGKIEKEAARVTGTIHEFLSISRKHSRKEVDQNIQLNEIINKSISLLDYYARTKQVEIILDLDPDLPNISGNYLSLLIFLTQLVFSRLNQINQSQTFQIITYQKEENICVEIDFNCQENSIFDSHYRDYSVCEKNGKTMVQFPVLMQTWQNLN